MTLLGQETSCCDSSLVKLKLEKASSGTLATSNFAIISGNNVLNNCIYTTTDIVHHSSVDSVPDRQEATLATSNR